MRLPAFVVVLAAAVSCYDPPAIPKERPLPCSSVEKGECPVGFVCVASRVCAPRNCRENVDCPIGLLCLGSRGCAVAVPGTDGAAGLISDAAAAPLTDAGADAAADVLGDR